MDDDHIEKVLEILKEKYSKTNGTSLNYENPVQLLIATILSAQTTDQRVNEIVSELFQKYKTAEDFVQIDREELENLIYSSGYYRNKAKWIKESCKILVDEYSSEMPKNIEELTELPGVGRKTANIVLSEYFGKNQGIPVDTHVKRLSKRIGLTDHENRDKIEKDLMEKLEKDRWYELSNLLIKHGREICQSQNPKCEECEISQFCSSYPIKKD